MKAKNLNIRSREISFRNREATLARLVAEIQTLRKLVRREEMKLARETLTVRKVAAIPGLPAAHLNQARAQASTSTKGWEPASDLSRIRN